MAQETNPPSQQSPTEVPRRSLAQQASFLMLGRLCALAFMFLLPVVLARLFSKSDFGLYRQFFLVFFALLTVAQMGMTAALSSVIPRDPEATPQFLSNTAIFLSGVGVLLAIGGFAARAYGPVLWGASWLWPLASVLGCFTGLMVASSFFEPLLIIEERSRATAVLIVGWDFLRGASLLGAALWSRDLPTALWCMTIAGCVRYLVLILYLRRRYQIHWRGWDQGLFKKQFALAGPMTVQAGAHLIEINVDRYLVMFLFSSAMFAVYSVGAFQIPIVEMVFYSIGDVVLPRLAALFGQNDKDGMVGLWRDTVRRSALLMLPMFAMIGVAHTEVILVLFSQRYADSVSIFAIYVWIIPTYIIANSLLLQASGQNRMLLIAGIFKPMLACVLVGIGVWGWQLHGAIAGLVLYHYIATFVYMLLSAMALEVPFRRLVPVQALLQIGALTLVGALPALALSWLSLPLFVALVCKPLVFLIVTGPLFWCFGPIDEEDRAFVLGALHRVTSILRRKPQRVAEVDTPVDRTSASVSLSDLASRNDDDPEEIHG